MQEESTENPNLQAVAQLRRILQNSYCLYSNVNSYNQCMNFNRFYEIAILCCLYTQSRILFRIQIFIRHIMLKKQQWTLGNEKNTIVKKTCILIRRFPKCSPTDLCRQVWVIRNNCVIMQLKPTRMRVSSPCLSCPLEAHLEVTFWEANISR